MKFRPLRRNRCGWVWELRYGENVCYLTQHMATVLAVLYIRHNRLVDRMEIEDILWGHLEDGGPEYIENALDKVIYALRRRLVLIAAPFTIEKEYGRGFRLVDLESIVRNGHTRWVEKHIEVMAAQSAL